MDENLWSITEVMEDWTAVESMLMTYSEEERQNNLINKENANLVLTPKFIPLYPKLLYSWLNINEAAIYWFIDFFLSNNKRFYCTNEQLAALINASEWTVSKAINRLKKLWYIETHNKIKAGWWTIRFITLTSSKKPEFNYINKWVVWKCNTDTCEIHKSHLWDSHGIYNKIIKNKKIDNKFIGGETKVSQPTELDNDVFVLDSDNSSLNTNDVLDCKEKEKGCGQKEKESSGVAAAAKTLISLLSDWCINNWIAYDNKQDIKYAVCLLKDEQVNILSNNIWKSILEFCILIIEQSIKIRFYKSIAWPKEIYNNYAEIYNKALTNSYNKKEVTKSQTFTFWQN